MIRPNYTTVRQTALSVATAVAISIPDIATVVPAGRKQTANTNAAGLHKSRACVEITLNMNELNLKQLLQHLIMMQYVQSDDLHASEGSNNGTECVNFRVELKGLLSDFLAFVCIVPTLSTDNTLIDNLESALILVDYIPSRTLYLMWKTMGGQLLHIRSAVNNLDQDLASFPPLEDFTVFNETTYTYEVIGAGESSSLTNDAIFDQSMVDRSFVDLFQARLEMYAYRLNSFTDLIPDTKMKKEEDADTSYATAALNSSDQVKIPLELTAVTF